jgi:hypothetical protein
LGGFEEILGLVVGHVATISGNVALLGGFDFAEAGDPALQPGGVAGLL